jgi:uncharacterized phage protein gp47/JayE
MLAALAVSAPGFSFELGTPERKIIDAVGEAISEAYIDEYLIGSLLDIDSKAGIELEQWVGIFGFGRLSGIAAAGTVRVELSTAATTDTSVPVGTQFYTRQGLPGTANPLYFSSTQAAVIPAGSLVIDIPIQCTVVGTQGNVPPDSIVYAGSIIGASLVTNLISLTGGVDVETDAELRQRFKDTFMRNVAGTADFYLGLAYQNINISQAVVFGVITKYVTQIVVPGADTTLDLVGSVIAESVGPLVTSSDVFYAWPNSTTVYQNLGQPDEIFYTPIDDYIFEGGLSPQITNVGSGQMVPGDIVDLEFEYTTQSSRNDPQNGITNKVDIFVNGVDPYTITERTVVSAQTFSTSSTDQLYTGNFARVGAPGAPLATNRFMRLGSVPIVSFPSSLTVGTAGETYQQDTGDGLGHYYLLRGLTNDAGSTREVAGIEWKDTGASSTTPITCTYVYNRVPEVLNAVVKQNKQIVTDTLVHQANYVYIRPYLDIEYSRSTIISTVNNAITTQLQTFFSGLGYGAWVDVSQLCLVVQQVIGVNSVSLTTGPGATDPDVTTELYGIQCFGNSADVTPLSIETEDFKLIDSALPIFLDVQILRKATR